MSQFYDSPLFINPATAGAFGGDYRLTSNYKNQWKSISSPYKTIAASADMKIFRNGIDKKNYLGAGLSFLRDKAGKSNMGLMQVNLNVSYKLKISDKSGIAAGAMAGLAQRSINTAGLRWDNQFDGAHYDPNRPSGEYALAESFNNIDLGAGLEYRFYDSHSKTRIILGASCLHLHQPKLAYRSSDPLYRKYLGYTSAQIRLPKIPVSIHPQVMYALQGPYQEILAGGNVRYSFGADNSDDEVILNTYTLTSSSVYAGLLYRVKDALVVTAGLELRKALSIGVSYDLNVSKLKVASALRGGMELSLIYKGFFYR